MESAWNPKIVAVDRDADSTVSPGECYRMVFVMSGRQRECDVEVVAAEPPARVVYAMRTRDDRGGEARIAYDLAPTTRGTRLRRTIGLSRAGIPAPFRILIWFLSRFGRPADTPYPERLREQAESAAASGTAAA